MHYLCKYKKKGGAPRPGSIVVIDEISEVQLHMLMEMAQWKMVGVRFILLGDFDGQLKPIFDRWQDAMTKKDIRESQFLHEMCGGLHLRLTKYRRGEDVQLFQRYTALYKYADSTNSKTMEWLLLRAKDCYTWNDNELISHFFVMSHKLRMKINHLMNAKMARSHYPVLFLPSPSEQETFGTTMLGQDMIIWKGMELLCCARKYAAKSPVNGCVYVVEAWDDVHVWIRLHQDYLPREADPVPPAESEGQEGQEDQDEESDADDMCEDEMEPPPKDVAVVQGKICGYKLTHAKAAKILRLQHALVYASIQGRTIRNKHIALMDTLHNNFTVRHLIVAMSRATDGKFVHILELKQEVGVEQAATKLERTKLAEEAAAINNRD